MHPVIVYEMALDVVIGVVAYFLIGKLRPNGSVFYLYLLMYGLGRFVIQFMREDAVWFLGLQQAHLLSLLLVAIALAFLVTRVRLAGSADSGGDDPDEGDDADAEVDSEEGQADAPPATA